MMSVASRFMTVQYLLFSHVSRWVLLKSFGNFSSPSRSMHNSTFTIPREQDHHRIFEALNTGGYHNMYQPL